MDLVNISVDSPLEYSDLVHVGDAAAGLLLQAGWFTARRTWGDFLNKRGFEEVGLGPYDINPQELILQTDALRGHSIYESAQIHVGLAFMNEGY